jgi:hypothetical protein
MNNYNQNYYYQTNKQKTSNPHQTKTKSYDGILTLYGQDITTIRSTLNGQKFIDTTFPACFNSIVMQNQGSQNYSKIQNETYGALAQSVGLQTYDPNQIAQRITWMRTSVTYIEIVFKFTTL